MLPPGLPPSPPQANDDSRRLVRPGVFVRRFECWCFEAQRDVVLPVPLGDARLDAAVGARVHAAYAAAESPLLKAMQAAGADAAHSHAMQALSRR